MNCEDIWNLISARMDGELAAGDRASLEAHLSGCDVCRSVEEAFRTQDAGLRRAFAPGRLAASAIADRTISRLQASGRGARIRRLALQLTAAAAAGFLVAALVFQPWSPPPEGPPIAGTPPESKVPVETAPVEPAPVEKRAEEAPSVAADNPKAAPGDVSPKAPGGAAELAFASGRVEVRTGEAGEWRALSKGEAIGEGARIRTAPAVLCELSMRDGSTVRLNESTEVQIDRSRGIGLVRGRLWSDVARGDVPFVVTVPEAAVTALGTKFDVELDGGKTWLTVVEGATKVTGASAEVEIVRAGERARIEGGRVLEKRRMQDVAVATVWVNKLLKSKGEEGKTELAGRLEDLLAAIGDAKLSFLLDQELRELGESCVRPLISYLSSPRSRGRTASQNTAAAVLAEAAPRWAVRDIIIHLLPHENRVVRRAAAAALERLTGETQGHRPEDWERRPWAEMEPAFDRWLAWWEAHKAEYPPEE